MGRHPDSVVARAHNQSGFVSLQTPRSGADRLHEDAQGFEIGRRLLQRLPKPGLSLVQPCARGIQFKIQLAIRHLDQRLTCNHQVSRPGEKPFENSG